MSYRSFWLQRTLCDVLDEIRKCHETRNYSYLPGLIEEAQSMGNRMEAALGEIDDLEEMNTEWHRLRKELDMLRREKKHRESE